VEIPTVSVVPNTPVLQKTSISVGATDAAGSAEELVSRFQEHGLHGSRNEGMNGCSRVRSRRSHHSTAPSGAKLVEKNETVSPRPGLSTTKRSLRILRIAPSPTRSVPSATGRTNQIMRLGVRALRALAVVGLRPAPGNQLSQPSEFPPS
jgi:hypothetical protein